MFDNHSTTFDNSMKDVFDKNDTSLLSDVSFAYQSEKENIFCDTTLNPKEENERLKYLLQKNQLKNCKQDQHIQKQLDLLKAEVQTSIQKNNEQWGKTLAAKDLELRNWQQKFHQMEQQLHNQSTVQANYVNKIQILLGENKKLNQGLQERIDNFEKLKNQVDAIELDKIQLVQDYERIIFEKQIAFQKDAATIEQKLQSQLLNQKNEAKKQLSILNDQNIQLNGLIKQQQQQINQLQGDLNLILNENQLRLQEYQKNINQLNEQIINFNEQANAKEKEFQTILIRYNELEKMQKEQNTKYKQHCEELKQDYSIKEQYLITEFEREKQELTNQLLENQKFVEDLQRDLGRIHSQICKIKQQKIDLIKQNGQLEEKILKLEEKLSFQSNQKDFIFQQCRSNTKKSEYQKQKLQLNLDENQQTIERKKSKPKPKTIFEKKLDSFGNKERSLSCLEIVKNQYPALLDHQESSPESEIQSPIILFRKWKLENSKND